MRLGWLSKSKLNPQEIRKTITAEQNKNPPALGEGKASIIMEII